jgi:DNA-binding IclR family transcriptional regulator
VRKSAKREAVLKVLEQAGEPLGPKAITKLAGMDYTYTRQLLSRMVEADEIERVSRGRYAPQAPQAPHV